MKVQFVLDLLKSNGNKFTVGQLSDYIRSQVGDKALERRTRRALFVTRKAGIVLEPVRDGGKSVVAYQLQGAIPAVVPTAKASKGTAKAKVVKTKTEVPAKVVKAKADKIVKAEAKVAAFNERTKANRDGLRKAVKEVDVSRISDEAKTAIKAKNLETMKAVSAKTKRLHPVSKRPLTDEQASVLDEFAALEKQAELEEIRAEENAALRANAPAFLFKESYSE